MINQSFKGELWVERKYAKIICCNEMQSLKESNNNLFVNGVRNFLLSSSCLENAGYFECNSSCYEAIKAFSLISILGYEPRFKMSIRFSADRKIGKAFSDYKSGVHKVLVSYFSPGVIDELKSLLAIKKKLYPELCELTPDEIMHINATYVNNKLGLPANSASNSYENNSLFEGDWARILKTHKI